MFFTVITQPVTVGISTPLDNKPLSKQVSQVFQAAILELFNIDVIPLEGPPYDIDTLLLKGAELVNQAEAISVTPEEAAAKENVLQRICHAQSVLEAAYQSISPLAPIQEKIKRLKTLEALFDRLNGVHLLWCPGKAYPPAIQSSSNSFKRYKLLQKYATSQGNDLFVEMFPNLFFAVTPVNLKTDLGGEILVDIYAFLDSESVSLNLQDKIKLFEALLDQLTSFSKSLSEENTALAQFIVNCQKRILELKDEPQWFTEKYMLEQIDSVNKHLTDLFKTHEESFANIKSIPQSIQLRLEKDKTRLLKISNWLILDFVLPIEKQVVILKLLNDQWDRMNQLIKIWSGKDNQEILNQMSSCNAWIMHYSRGKPVKISSSALQPVTRKKTPNPSESTTTPTPQTRKIQPTKPTSVTSKIEFIFKTTPFVLFFFGVAFFLYRRFRPLS